MRIGILTLPLNTNYGGILQAYALQTILERMGHEVRIINYVPHKFVPWYKLIFLYLSRAFRKIILGEKNIHIFLERDFNRSNSPESHFRIFTKKFIDKYIKITYIYDFEEISSDQFEAIIVGSDQIWRYQYIAIPFEKQVGLAFLSFATSWNIRRIAYAASFGTDVWDYSDEDTLLIQSLVKRFSAISVREDSSVRLCKEFLGVEAIHVLDPTMLLNLDDYNMIAGNDDGKEGDLMCYILDNNSYKENVIHRLSVETGLTPFISNSKKDEPQPPVEQWLQGFNRSKLIITDSFHACAFSIIYQKPFFVIENSYRGNTRIESLLTMFGLENRLIKEGEMISKELICTPIDYSMVNLQVDKWRDVSFAFLKAHLGLQK